MPLTINLRVLINTIPRNRTKTIPCISPEMNIWLIHMSCHLNNMQKWHGLDDPHKTINPWEIFGLLDEVVRRVKHVSYVPIVSASLYRCRPYGYHIRCCVIGGSDQCLPWWRHEMEIFPRYWPFVRGIHRWIPHTKASDAVHWWFLWSASELTVGQTIARLVIWDTIKLIMTSL